MKLIGLEIAAPEHPLPIRPAARAADEPSGDELTHADSNDGIVDGQCATSQLVESRAKRCCEVLTLAQSCASLRTVTDAFSHAIADSDMQSKAAEGHSNRERILMKVTSPSFSDCFSGNDKVGTVMRTAAEKVEQSRMMVDFVTSIQKTKISLSGVDSEESSFDAMLDALPSNTLLFCLHFDQNKDDVVTKYNSNDDIKSRFLRCGAIMKSDSMGFKFDMNASTGISTADVDALQDLLASLVRTDATRTNTSTVAEDKESSSDGVSDGPMRNGDVSRSQNDDFIIDLKAFQASMEETFAQLTQWMSHTGASWLTGIFSS